MAFNRSKHMGRRAEGSYLQIPHFVLNSPQWAALPATAGKLLWELARQYKGNNNGDLSATMTLLRPRGWNSEATVWKHLGELERRGWIRRTRQGGRHIGCNLYAITFWHVDACGGKHSEPTEHKPSHAWKNAIGTSQSGVRKGQKLECKAVGLQKVERKPVRLRSVS